MFAPKVATVLVVTLLVLLFITAVLGSARFALTARAENIARTVGTWAFG
jgi:hypothetical protein